MARYIRESAGEVSGGHSRLDHRNTHGAGEDGTGRIGPVMKLIPHLQGLGDDWFEA